MTQKIPSSTLARQTQIQAVAGGAVNSPAATLSGYWGLDQTLTGSINGNAGTATTLQYTRKIAGQDFNGSQDVSFNSDAVSEGSTNQYFTTARARGAIATPSVAAASGGGNLTYSSSTGVLTFTPPNLSGYLTTSTASSTYAPLNGATFTATITVPTIDAQGALNSDSGAVRWYIPGSSTNNIFKTYQRASDNTLITQYGAFGGGSGSFANIFYLDSSGNVTTSGNVTAYSDITLKDNIETIPNALNKVTQVRGVTYTRRDLADKQTRYTGVIAQEIESVLPEAVMTDGDGIKSVAYGNVIGLLIESIKELNAKIEQLEKIVGAGK
jgi:hypothetical protein